MNQKTTNLQLDLRKLKLTMAGSKLLHKKQTTISTQTTSPEQFVDAARVNGIVEKEVAQFKLLEREQVHPKAQQWSLMKEQRQRLADMGILGQGEMLSSIQGGPSSNLFHGQADQIQVSVKRWLLHVQEEAKFTQYYDASFSPNQQELVISKSQTIKYKSPYSYWFSSLRGQTCSNKPGKLGITISNKS